jgi:hypothetical protein
MPRAESLEHGPVGQPTSLPRHTCLRKFAYRLLGTNRVIWAIIVAQREGLSLLFVRKPDDKRAHALTVAIQDREQVFEDAPNASRFHLESEDVAPIGARLQAVGEHLDHEDFRRPFFAPDEPWQDD